MKNRTMANNEFSLLVNIYCALYLCLQTAPQQQVGRQPIVVNAILPFPIEIAHHLASIVNLLAYHIPPIERKEATTMPAARQTVEQL